MADRDRLTRDLAELGRTVPTLDADGIERAVMGRLGEPVAAPAPTRRPLVRAAAVGLALLAALLAVPPVRAEVADWFGFGSVVVHEDDDPSPAPKWSPTPTLGDLAPDEAAARVDVELFEIPELGTPTGASLSSDDRLLSLFFANGLRLDQSRSDSFTISKAAADVERVLVDGQEALWFPDAHEVEILEPDGSTSTEGPRPAGRTLIWMVGDTTLRLEGDLSREEAVRLAETARPWD